jgi:ribose transport system permease protein
VGSNITAVRFSGINVNLPLILSYVISGVLAAAAGLLFLGYLGMANMFFVDIYTMGSIAAAVIGGTAFFSGIGTIAGTIAGTIIMRFIFNLLVMFRVADAGRMIAEGLIILVIMALYNLSGRE